ncbi:hypothetical protein N7537_008236 [Penicillium hordei]|uniref:Uncharacterized protein n=1 Tax=Penicillium hordei TaxID=40994 RepID=A0AAD6E041_9EURO|nr:uncharacterized protein N7537_008236 [Penicillium hordei]KAJ5598152.1 hypothetical protein N7537_008236 [Penicillium hordei]
MTVLNVFYIFFCACCSLAAPVPLSPRANEDSVVGKLLRLAVEKGAETALKIGGVVLLFLFIRDLFTFGFWWGRVEVLRSRDSSRRPDSAAIK